MTIERAKALALDTGTYGDEGRFVTLHGGQVIFITDSAGIVPSRLRGDAKDVKRFSRAAIERHLIEHHEQMGGGVTAHEDAQLNAHTSGNPFTFHGSLPEEVKHELAGNPHLRRLFRVTQDAKEAGGADVMGAMGEDKYFQAAHRYAGSQLGAAKQTAANSPDPEVQFLNEIHSNLPGRADRAKVVPVKANELRVGEQFTIHGVHFRVAEDADGYRVLQHGIDYSEQTPVDALTTIPVDAGSFKQSGHVSRFKSDAAAPFSAAEIAGVRLVRVGSGRTVRVPTRNVRVVKLGSGRVVDVALALDATPGQKKWPERGADLWTRLHTAKSPNQSLIDSITNELPPSCTCDCRDHWRAMLKRTPPDFGAGWSRWVTDRHNEVNKKLGRKAWTQEQSAARWPAKAGYSKC